MYQKNLEKFSRVLCVGIVAFGLSACASFKQMLQCSLLGAPLGALVGDLVGKGNKARWAGAAAGVAVCAIIADEIERRRREALQQERDLDRQIADQSRANQVLREENAALQSRLDELRGKRAYLERTRRGQDEERARIAGEIQGEVEAARERIKIVDQRLAIVDEQLSNPRLSPADRALFSELRDNLLERRRILQQIAMLA